MKAKLILGLSIFIMIAWQNEAQAATRTWDGSSSGNWATGANWAGGTAPTAGDDLVFPTGVTQLVMTNNFSPNRAFNSITILGVNYILRGNPIILTNGVRTGNSSAANALDTDVELRGNQTFYVTNQSASLLLRATNLNLNANTLTVNGLGRTEISNSISGSGGVIKLGANVLEFYGSQPNTYTGSTTVSEGTLQLNKSAGVSAIAGALGIGDGAGGAASDVVELLAANQIGNSVTVSIDSSGVLDLNDHNDTIGALALLDSASVTTGTGTLTLGGDVTVNSSGNASISGNLSLGSVTRGFHVTGVPVTSTHLSVSAQISGSAGIMKDGLSGMVLSGSNSFSGTVTVNAGTLTAGNSFALGATNAGIIIRSNATLAVQPNIHIGPEPLTLDSTNAFASLGSFAGSGSNSYAGNITLLRDSIIRSDATLNLTGAIGGSGGLTKSGSGTLRVSGANANTYVGATTVTGGVMQLGKNAGVAAVPGDLEIGVGSFATVSLLAAQQIADGSDVHSTINGTLELGGNNESVASISGDGVLALGAGTVALLAPSGVYTYAGSILGSGGISKFGDSTVILTGTNSYAGTTSVIVGTLQVDGSQSFSPVFLNDGAHLRGSGTVGRIDIEGSGSSVSPGDSPGILTCSNFNAAGAVTSTLAIELNGTTPGTGYDQLNVRGSVNLTGIVLSVSLNFSSALSNQFLIINNDGADPVLGTFTGLAQDAILKIGAEQLRISYTGGTGNDVVLTQISSVLTPTLNIEGVPSNAVRLLWSTNFTGFNLESNTNLATTNWGTASPPPSVLGTNNVVTNSVTAIQRFYRLHK
jgi:autotransporter-associated beta strand protein